MPENLRTHSGLTHSRLHPADDRLLCRSGERGATATPLTHTTTDPVTCKPCLRLLPTADITLITRIRDTLATDLDRHDTPVGVQLLTSPWDNGYFLTHTAEVLLADGTVQAIDFGDEFEYPLLTDKYGARSELFTVAVDLRSDTVTTSETTATIHERFALPTPLAPALARRATRTEQRRQTHPLAQLNP